MPETTAKSAPSWNELNNLSGHCRGLEGRWVFLVDDVFPVLLMLEGIVFDLECFVFRAESLGDALYQARSLDIDVAILDTCLHGQSVLPVAEELERRRIPLAFAASNCDERLPLRWQEYPLIFKPYRREAVRGALMNALAMRSGR